MLTAIVYAMDSEIQSMLEICGEYEKETHCGVNFYVTKKDIILCTVGVGKVNAAFGTALLCEKYHPDAVINAGVAGSFRQFDQSTLIIADRCVQHDVDTSPIGDPKFLVSTVNRVFFDTDFTKEAQSLAKSKKINFCTGLVATGDRFMTDGALSREIEKQLSPIACEMEACAVAQVCLREGVKFLALKTASDCIFSEGQSEQYRINLSEAAKTLNTFVYDLALSLSDKK